MNHVAPTQDPSSTAAGCDEELRQTSAAEEKNMEKCTQVVRNLIKMMLSSTLRQTNVNKTSKEGLPKLQEALESLAKSKRTTLMVDRCLTEGKKIKRMAEEVISFENFRIKTTSG